VLLAISAIRSSVTHQMLCEQPLAVAKALIAIERTPGPSENRKAHSFRTRPFAISQTAKLAKVAKQSRRMPPFIGQVDVAGRCY
jgi:hypothetical protein